MKQTKTIFKVNSEFYSGWLDHWGEAHNKIHTSEFLKPFSKLLSMNANINIYMFHGKNFNYFKKHIVSN